MRGDRVGNKKWRVGSRDCMLGPCICLDPKFVKYSLVISGDLTIF